MLLYPGELYRLLGASSVNVQIFYLLTTVPIAEQNNPTMNKHMIGLIGLKRSAEEIYDASAAALTLEAPRSLYSSPGYNNISQ
jgi:hypothetical protein